MVISAADGAALAARAAAGPPFNVSLNYTCASGTWIAVGADGRLAQVGWRKYTEAGALRWALDELLHLAAAQDNATAAAAVFGLIPSGSVLNGFAHNVTFPSVRALRRVAGSSALLDFRLQCAGEGDNDCGPWDRIISGYARCWPSAAPPSPLPPLVEIARWITPFRRSTGRWQSSADLFVALAGNSSASGGDDAAWTCEVSASTCCEQWLGALDLLLPGDGAGAYAAPFMAVPLNFANTASHFGPGFNANRTALLSAPASFARASLFAFITGHGSDPPPPAGQGCEYAPTSHAFALSSGGAAAPSLVVNSSDIAFEQYMLAGSMFGCSDKVAIGVIGNQHGDYRDGRNGWCPGNGVRPLAWDVTSAVGAGGVLNVSYAALSYYVDGSHPSADGCGGDIVLSSAVLFYA
jgi:hypothetical protein